VVLAFAAGLLAKQMVVTLPLILLLLDYWPLGRYGVPGRRGGAEAAADGVLRAASEKLPLLLLSAAASLMTLRAQREALFREVPLPDRAANALVSLVAYLKALLLPAGLTVYYPFPPSPRWLAAAAAALLLALMTGAVLLRGRRDPFLPVGWLWYLVGLAPVIGLIQVGGQAMADRYAYLPSVGLFIPLVWGACRLAAGRTWARRALPALIVLVAVFCGMSRAQVLVWADSGTLFSHALAVNPDDWVAHVNLAIHLKQQGKTDEALAHYREALRLRPGRDAIAADLLYNLGNALLARGELSEALLRFQEAVGLKPSDPGIHFNFAVALLRAGRQEEAGRHFAEARRLEAGARPAVPR
jgi:tetratricopeptide (TPR) repeat protein